MKSPAGPSFTKRGSIRLGFLRLLALLLAIALVCSSLLVWSAYDFARDQAKRQILDTARALSRVLDGEFARYELTLRALATSPSIAQGDWRAVDRQVRAAVPDPGAWFTLTDMAGRQRVNTRGAALSGPVRIWPGIGQGAAHICDLQDGPGGNRHICVEVPVFAGRTVAYVLTVWLRPDAMATVLARQKLPADWRATILDSREALVWRSRLARQLLGKKASSLTLAALSRSDENIIRGQNSEHRPVYVAFSRSPTSRWTFVLAVPRGQLDAGIWSGMTLGLLLVAGLMAIGAFASVRWIRGFTRAVDMLAAGAGALARRQYHAQPDTKIRELNDIAAAFGDADRMLKLRDADVDRMNASLADRVDAAVAAREVALGQLHETRKLETLGQLTGGVAHDFNNLLSPIMGSLEMLQIRLADDARSVKLIDAALTSSERAKLLVSRLLSFSRRQALRPQAVDVSALVGDMADLISRSLGSSIKVDIDAGEGLAPAHVDRNQLELALLNLSVNARDAMPDGGTLSLSVSQLKPSARVAPAAAGQDHIRIRLIDTGVGMDEATLAHAIEPFFTTKPHGQGTGLGLSMVHGLAAQSGGAFLLSSEPSVGTVADIWLPVSRVKPRAPALDDNPSPASIRILLVDDEEMVRSGTAEMLLDLGFGVTDTGSPAEALALVRTDPVDCLVTDYKMPGMNGGELIAAARDIVPELPVVLMSGFSGSDADIAGVERLEKPFRQKHLLLAVETAIGRKVAVAPNGG